MPDTWQIMVNGPAKIFVEQGGQLIQLDKRFANEAELQRVVRQLLALAGKTLSPQTPLMDLRLADGARMTISVPPVTTATSFTIRKPSNRSLDLSEIMMKGAMSPEMAMVLRLAVQLLGPNGVVPAPRLSAISLPPGRTISVALSAGSGPLSMVVRAQGGTVVAGTASYPSGGGYAAMLALPM